MTSLVKLQLGYDQLARIKIDDNYSWHKKAWSMFEHHADLKERNFRPERDKGPTPFLSRYIQKSNYAELLILSRHEPLQPDWCLSDQWQLIQIDETYLSQVSYFFDLYANPTKSVEKPDEYGGYTKNNKRLTLMYKASQKEWLVKKGNDHGFQLIDEIPLRIDKPVYHPFKRKGKRGLHIGVRFQGALSVVERDLFQKAFHEGIGSAKGFGFGMLMIKPAQF